VLLAVEVEQVRDGLEILAVARVDAAGGDRAFECGEGGVLVAGFDADPAHLESALPVSFSAG